MSTLEIRNFIRMKRKVWQRDNYTCRYCSVYMGGNVKKNKRNPKAIITTDHVIPRSKGGETTMENLVTCCEPCNARKADNLPSTEKTCIKVLAHRVSV